MIPQPATSRLKRRRSRDTSGRPPSRPTPALLHGGSDSARRPTWPSMGCRSMWRRSGASTSRRSSRISSGTCGRPAPPTATEASNSSSCGSPPFPAPGERPDRRQGDQPLRRRVLEVDGVWDERSPDRWMTAVACPASRFLGERYDGVVREVAAVTATAWRLAGVPVVVRDRLPFVPHGERERAVRGSCRPDRQLPGAMASTPTEARSYSGLLP